MRLVVPQKLPINPRAHQTFVRVTLTPCTPDSRARWSSLTSRARWSSLHNERRNMTLQASAPGLPAALTGFECPSCSCNCTCTGVSAASAWPTYGYPWVVEVLKLVWQFVGFWLCDLTRRRMLPLDSISPRVSREDWRPAGRPYRKRLPNFPGSNSGGFC